MNDPLQLFTTTDLHAHRPHYDINELYITKVHFALMCTVWPTDPSVQYLSSYTVLKLAC